MPLVAVVVVVVVVVVAAAAAAAVGKLAPPGKMSEGEGKLIMTTLLCKSLYHHF